MPVATMVLFRFAFASLGLVPFVFSDRPRFGGSEWGWVLTAQCSAYQAIDADGEYRAYRPDNRIGLDSIEHAGRPGNWWALATDTGSRTPGQPSKVKMSLTQRTLPAGRRAVRTLVTF